MKLNLKA
ncbi:hypothetical protein VCHC51A1_3081, partial [Vibrio cholerae HC-51A1]